MKLLLTTIAAVLLVGCGPSAPDISIHEAARAGNIEVVKKNLAAGVDVNAKNNDGKTPLDVTEGDKDIIDLLRKLGGKNTTIHRAVAAGNFEEIKEFLTSGGNVNKLSSSSKSTLLHLAVWNGHKKIVQYLLTKGADINPKNNLGFTPLDNVQPREPNIAALLRKHGAKTGEELKAEGK